MKIKIAFLLIFTFFFTLRINAQEINYGHPSKKELEEISYPKDTTANAVVIYEKGNSIFQQEYNSIYLKTTVYRKIKIFNKGGEEHATVKINIYNDDNNRNREKVINLKAITHNLNEPSTYLNPKQVYTNRRNENWKEVSFTFPNTKPGSVLEYQYDLISKFYFNFSGWTFQSDIPKIYSEFHALIPGNWSYNRDLKGLIPLSTNTATLKSRCFSLDGGTTADCEELTYIMRHIPAFLEEEEYSTTKNNYISRIKFELAEIFYADGTSKKYTTSWKETDIQLKKDKNIGGQSKSKVFFSKNIPIELLTINDKLSQSKSIYKYIQNHFSLNKDKTSIYKEVDVKKAYQEKLGSVSEINLALVSALKAADIDAKIILLSTRDRGFPTMKHAVMTDFNYLAAHVTIDDQTYLLDATDDYLSFDMLPFKALNSYGRVLDFKNGSYWFSITPKSNTYQRIRTMLTMNEDGILIGDVKETNNGYFSKFKRELISTKSEEKYLIDFENNAKNLEILAYTNEELHNNENPLIENFEIEFEAAESIGNNIYLNPFIERYSKNPFQLNQRNYPVNFGFKINETYQAKIIIPDSFIIKSIPENIAFKLPNNGGSFVASFKKSANNVQIYTKINLNQTIYKVENYQYLKEFFNQIIKTQNSLITIEKSGVN